MLAACTAPNPAYQVSTDATEGNATLGGSLGLSDGPENTDAALTTDSDLPSCGNGVREGDEVCDDGVNDGRYGGCRADCRATGPRCGDGIVDDEFEECDDADDDLRDGCLPDCFVPTSCLEIYEFAPADDDVYLIHPGGSIDEPFPVYCDMATDGGGYTFFKMEYEEPVYAFMAEDMCRALGMKLWIPRTEAHLQSGVNVANDPDFGPSVGDTYLRIMGVYAQFPGAACPNQPLTSDNPECEFRAGDDHGYWVDDRGLFSEPSGNNGNSKTESSLLYLWRQGVLTWYDDSPGPGGFSAQFMCDVGDKY